MSTVLHLTTCADSLCHVSSAAQLTLSMCRLVLTAARCLDLAGKLSPPTGTFQEGICVSGKSQSPIDIPLKPDVSDLHTKVCTGTRCTKTPQEPACSGPGLGPIVPSLTESTGTVNNTGVYLRVRTVPADSMYAWQRRAVAYVLAAQFICTCGDHFCHGISAWPGSSTHAYTTCSGTARPAALLPCARAHASRTFGSCIDHLHKAVEHDDHVVKYPIFYAQVDVPSGTGSVTVGGKTLELLQFHWHRTSEHTFDGQHEAMELHLVMEDTATGLSCSNNFLSTSLHGEARAGIGQRKRFGADT